MATAIKYPTSTNAVQKTLGAQLLAGATTSMTLNNVVGIQNKAGVCVVDRVDANGNATASKREYITFTGVSGSTLTGLTRNSDGGGTDQDHAVGAIVEFVSDVLQQQAIIDGLLLTVTTAGALNKAAGSDVTTGTDDAKIVTCKAIKDAGIVAVTVPVKATGAELDTGTDDAKFSTAKALKDSHNVPSVAPSTSGNILTSDGTDWTSATPPVASTGWTTISGTFTYASATTINVSSGAASIYSKGDKIRFQNNDSGTWLYAYVIAIADTLLTVAGNTVPNATLTDAYYSHQTSPLGFPTYFAYTPTISWTASVAPSGSPVRKDYYWVEGSICHMRTKAYGWTAGTGVTGATVTLPFGISTQFQNCVGQILIQDALAPISNAYVRNTDVIITVASINASQIDVIADYYY